MSDSLQTFARRLVTSARYGRPAGICVPRRSRLKHAWHGFTLVEMMAALLLLVIIVVTAVPAMRDVVEKRRLSAAAEDLYGQIQYARTEAVKQSVDLNVNVVTDGTTTWCLGISGAAGCDCTLTDPAAVGACVLDMDGTNVIQTVGSATHPTISLTAGGGNIAINRVRGTTTAATITLQSPQGWQIQIVTSALGRVQVCSPSGTAYLSGYPTC